MSQFRGPTELEKSFRCFDLDQFHLKGKGRIWRYHWMKTLRSISLRYVDRQSVH
jgi:hypothetical protein